MTIDSEKNIGVLETPIDDELKDSYLNYAMSVIISRALPDVRDGLKPSQRRILIAMNDLGLGPRSKFRKCAKIAGDTSGNYHPHGEQVIYPTLVRLAQDFVMRYTLIEGQGNFGSIDGDPPAAMRYTEARLTEISSLMLEDLDKDTVNFVPNYDETRTEPVVLPASFPNLICNGSSGIAVGMATNIPPHNLNEVCDAIIFLIDHPDCKVEDLLNYIKGPDFPTGATICGLENIKNAYTTGKGHLTIRSKLHTENINDTPCIIVTEIPYNQLKSRIIERIAELVKDEIIKGITDIRDESDKNGIRIVIELKSEEEQQLVINQLYNLTPLQDTYSVILLALVNKKPVLLTLKDILQQFINHRKEVVRRRIEFLLKKAQEQEHILEGLVKALSQIDEIIQTIKSSKDAKHAQLQLISLFFLTEIQADAILKMQLQKLTALEQDKILNELKKLRVDIADYKSILSNEFRILEIIKESIYEVKEKFPEKRKTQILPSVEEFEDEDLIPDEDVGVILSNDGYIKRMLISSYRKQQRGGRGVTVSDIKEGDFIKSILSCSTHDIVLFFTTRGKVFGMKSYDIPEMSRTSRGRAIQNIFILSPDEKVTSAISVRNFSENFLLFATNFGIVKKVPLLDFENLRKSGIIAISLQEKEELISVKLCEKDKDILIATREGMAIRFKESSLRPVGRTAHGVIGIRLRENDRAIAMEQLLYENESILTVCENGYGKRTDFSDYRVQNRGGYGIINIKTSERNGKVVGTISVDESDDVLLVTSKGMLIRTPVNQIRLTRRNAQGVKLLTLDEDDKLVSITKITNR